MLAEVHYSGEKSISLSKIKHIYSCNSFMMTDGQEPSFIQPSSERCVRRGSPAERRLRTGAGPAGSRPIPWRSPTSIPTGPSLVVLQRLQLNGIAAADTYTRTGHAGLE